MVYAYIRVSTEEQSFEAQKYEISRWCAASGRPVDKWVSEKVTGTADPDKRTLGRLLSRMKRGDHLVCTELSRLGRNMMMVMSILNECMLSGISVHTIKDNFDLSDNINSKIIAFAFSLAAEIERNLISQRTKEALAAKKMAGVKLGRPGGRSKKKDRIRDSLQEIIERHRKGETLLHLSECYGVNRSTLARYIKEYNSRETEF